MTSFIANWELITPKALAAHLGVAPQKIISWIKSGELTARNVATSTSTRPIYRIARADFDRFWSARASVPPTPAPPRRNRGTRAPVREFV
jgi:hypothetical protein